MGFSDVLMEGWTLCSAFASLIMTRDTLASAYGLTGSLWAVRQRKVVASLVVTLWGAMTGFREEYFQQYVVLNLAVCLFSLWLHMTPGFHFITVCIVY